MYGRRAVVAADNTRAVVWRAGRRRCSRPMSRLRAHTARQFQHVTLATAVPLRRTARSAGHLIASDSCRVVARTAFELTLLTAAGVFIAAGSVLLR